jgi:hypothetical protein
VGARTDMDTSGKGKISCPVSNQNSLVVELVAMHTGFSIHAPARVDT